MEKEELDNNNSEFEQLTAAEIWQKLYDKKINCKKNMKQVSEIKIADDLIIRCFFDKKRIDEMADQGNGFMRGKDHQQPETNHRAPLLH